MPTYVISAEDRNSILEFLKSYRPFLSSESEQIALLKMKLRDAVIVPESKLARTIVAIYSTANVVDLERRVTETYTLVYPHHADAGRRRLSLLSPLGTALLGCSEGDFFECAIQESSVKLAVKEVLLQPREGGQRGL